MGKLKTRRGIKKRFRLTKSGKIKRGRANRGHMLSSKTESRKRGLKRAAMVDKTQARMIKRMLPYA